jgi:predicted permease
MMWTPPGFDLNGLATASVSLPRPRYPTPPVQREFFDTLLDRVCSLSGVQAAAYGTPPPGGGGGRFVPFGHEHDSTVGSPVLSLYGVDPDYFRIAGIPLKEGRLFNGDDGPTSPPVAIIDDGAARRYWPGQSAVGQRFRYSPYVPWLTVVGVAGHVKTRSFIEANGTVQAYLPTSQSSSTSTRMLLIRIDGDLTAGLNGTRSILHGMDATLDLQYARPVANMYDDVFLAPRFYLVLMSIFAVLALITAAVGLFGSLNYSVSQRTREIGVRLALGASIGAIRALVVRDALLPVAGGIVVGLTGSFWLTRYLGSMLYGVTPHDIRAYGGAVVLLLVVASIAIVLPVRRATRVDPVTTLRVE